MFRLSAQSANSCEVWIDKFNLLIKNGKTSCVKGCKIGQIILLRRCVDYNNECCAYSISANFCDFCKNMKFQFEGNCYIKYTELNNVSIINIMT